METGEALLSTVAEKIELDRYLPELYPRRRWLYADAARSERDAEIIELAETLPVRKVAERTGVTQDTVRKVLQSAA
jgi:hypothetical protein